MSAVEESLSIRRDARYHSDGSQTVRDVGCPPYGKANVLLSEGEFRYLGKEGKSPDQSRYPSLVDVLSRLCQGHRVNHNAKVAAELEKLRAEVWKKLSRCIVGDPSHPIPERDGVCSCGERRGR